MNSHFANNKIGWPKETSIHDNTFEAGLDESDSSDVSNNINEEEENLVL